MEQPYGYRCHYSLSKSGEPLRQEAVGCRTLRYAALWEYSCHRSESHCRNSSRASEISTLNVSSPRSQVWILHPCSQYLCFRLVGQRVAPALTSVACRPRNQASVLHDDWQASSAVLRCSRKTTCISQASQLQVSSCDVESAHARLSALHPQSALLIVLRQQHGWSLAYVPTSTAGSLKMFTQTASQRKTGENHHGKQVSSTDGVPLTAVTYSLEMTS